ncbi:hypothetical protein BZM27_52915 [Paraburkholderia steynii]|uniref:Uncharacterized protein n=1 Tax=Paraburkholderia steynii TaxID=1245441 RepID=A0A4R0X3B0_9BURK|nr:hypothetical protein BZM27_52915 [Paraburkholderia steynii]
MTRANASASCAKSAVDEWRFNGAPAIQTDGLACVFNAFIFYFVSPKVKIAFPARAFVMVTVCTGAGVLAVLADAGPLFVVHVRRP